MSSVPVQLLIYVMEEPTCGSPPVFIPVNRCLDVKVNTTISFNISVLNKCNPADSDIDAIIMSSSVPGMNISEEKTLSNNASIAYVTFLWKPQQNQVGSRQLCLLAFTE